MPDAKAQLLHLLESKAFNPMLHATNVGRSDADRRKLEPLGAL